ncbi:cynT, can [Ceraceosorus bombacis]|uniref:Carbonic anhydrase n=1 Tax=Ceraceosorus bombacis TaxID=401625 RepID=A0A0N7LAR7_9BASI|nr:cynT, can [Ceraceosorus bombacis]
MSVAKEVANANQEFVSSRKTGQLPLPPARKLTVLTCMDARIDPVAAFGIKEGDAHVIRNAGARAPDAVRSLVISQQLLGTDTILVIGHSDCGMLTFQTPQAREIVAKQQGSHLDSKGKAELDSLNFLEFPDLHSNVASDVAFLKSNTLIKPNTDISGWVYDVGSGKLSQVA